LIGWNETRYAEIRDIVGPFLESISYKAEHITYLPISGLNGINLFEEAKGVEGLEWYKGSSLLHLLETMKPPKR